MDPVTVGISGVCFLFFLLLIGLPIAFSLMTVGFLGITLLTSLNAALPKVAATVYESASHYPYTIIPLFIVMGSYADITGISDDLYNTFDKWLRRLPGGLGMATIAAIAGFWHADEDILGLIANNRANSWLHTIIALVFLYLGFCKKCKK